MQYINFIEEIVKNSKIHPDKPAVIDQDGQRVTTYAQLVDKAKRMANYIKELDLPHNSYILFQLPTSMECLVTELGIWMNNHVVVPIGEAFPQERIDYIKNHSESPLMITPAHFNEAMKHRAEAFVPNQQGSNDALLIYTSGSTGNPKGIVHDFEFINIRCTHSGSFLNVTENTILGVGAPFYFIASLMYTLCLTQGGTVHIISSENMRDADRFKQYIAKHSINHIFISPSILKNCGTLPTCIQTVVAGSEKLSDVEPNGYKLLNCYGMTETGGLSTRFEVDKSYSNTPIGKAVPPDVLTIRDEEGNILPPGTEGEICLEGKFTKGYFKDPERTAELFRGGVLHTGDLGVELPDGNIQYLNRKDWMVKINGQRVEPGEVENVIKRLDGITQAVVKGFSSDTGSTYLCAYYTSSQPLAENDIREFLLTQLAEYMIPSFIIHLDKFPINANGKLDRKSLLPPDRSTLRATYVAPQTKVEEELCTAFSDVLKIEKIGVDDDFFHLGGDSIRVIMMQQRCPDLPLSAKMIFTARTPRKLAKLCEAYHQNELEKLDFYPLSQTQMGIYAECMNRQGEVAYNNPLLLQLPLNIPMERLTEAIQHTIAAHPYVTTRISLNSQDEPQQTRPENADFHPVVEMIKEDDFQELKDELIQPYNLLKDDLFRIRLFKTEKSVYLFIDFHHIIFDGASFEIFIDDLNKAFAHEDLIAETYTGCEVAQEEEINRKSEVYEKAQAWYTEQFGNMDLDSLPLPDLRKEGIEYDQATLRGFNYPTLQKFCETEGITMNVLTTAAFGYLLGIYTNAQESLFATIYNGRSDLKTIRTMAMMVKTLPVYCKWDEHSDMYSYLQQVKALMLQTMQHDIYSYAELAASNSSINSQVLFAYQGFLSTPEKVCDAPYVAIPLTMNSTGEKLALQLFLLPNEEMELKVEYQSQLYSAGFINRLMECYRQVLSEFVNKKYLHDIVCVPQQQAEELDSFNPEPMEYDAHETIVSLFRKAAVQYPEHKALVFNEEVITYREADELTERIAQYLASQEIGRGDVVSILIPRSTYMATASLGVLKTAACYQPLDPTYPDERLNFMMKDAQAKFLITTHELRNRMNEYNGPVLYLEDIGSLPDSHQQLSDPLPSDPFTLLYTSGTTGLPKGCQVLHSNLMAYCMWFLNFYKFTADSCGGAYASYGFDANMQDMYPPLTIGGTCCIVGEDIRLNLIELNKYLTENHVSHLFITTQVGRQFAIEYPTHPTLRHLTVGGETLVPFNPPTNYQMYNGYGPTECTICSTIFPIKVYEDNIPIGRPTSVRVYVVDRWGHRVPIGALGELRISGAQVSNGYLNRPEQTSKVFIENPFSREAPYQRMYCTGDIARYKLDGNLEYIGRRDKQVKIRGFRVELSEVESVIRNYPGIKDATVAAFDDPNGGKFIAAYVVADENINIKSLHAFIREQKPPYMVPATTMQIEKIPLNQNMKVNRRALPTPEFKVEEEEAQRTPNILEDQLQKIIGEIVHVEKVPFNTDLSSLGLTSISSIKLSTAIYKEYQITLSSKFLLNGATLLLIENEILQHWLQGGNNTHAEDKVSETSEITASPLSYSQLGVYYDCMKHPTETIYNIPTMLSFDKEIQADKVEKAVHQLLAAHPSLQSHFETRDQVVMQVRDTFQPNITRIQLSEEKLINYKRDFVKPFNLSKSPLYRVAVVETEKRIALLIDFHHLVFDGASLDLFIQGLRTLLEGKEIAAETYSYFHYSMDEKAAEETEAYRANHDFFHQMLATCDGASELPADCKGRAEDGILKEVVHPIAYQQIEAYCKSHHTTPAAVCLAAAFYTISRYVNNKDVYISTISNGRSNPRTAETFGMFVKTLPLGIHIQEQTVSQFITESGRLLSDTVDHEVYPFARIANEYNFAPSIVYACQLGILNEWSVNGHPIELEGLELKTAKFHLSIHIEEREGKPSISLQYNDALYSTALMESVATSMAFVLEGMMSHPEAPLKQVSLLDPTRAQLVNSFRLTGEAQPGLYHEAIERQAEKQPEKIALLAADATFTYRQLNVTANRIAHALIERGVKLGDRIALLLPRTSRVILSMFGVMKSGAAYIPCDPEYPVERINHILSDSGAAYIITTANRLSDFEPGRAIDVEELIKHQDESNPHSGVTPDDLVYLIYTSGSTGKPKGVMLRHAGICNYLNASKQNRHIHALVSDADTFLSVTTVSFDMSLKEIGTTLYNGLTLVLADEQQANNPILLAELFLKTNANAFNATPSRMMQYIELAEFRRALEQCKIIMCGGEKYPDQLLVRLREITKARIFNTYGPTEITVSSNGKELTHSDVVTIGQPLLNYQEFIVDSDGNELPPHVTGELYIGGVGVALGYQNLKEMTAERFIEYKGIHVYKSGDYAQWTDHGEVIILGRTDTQVKLRGLRIELGEVESCILKYPGIRNAVVAIRKINQAEHLCAYFTAQEEIDTQALKEALKTTLAQYMVPTAYLQMESIPLTPNGKTNMKALPEPQLLVTSGGEEPSNEIEETFCNIFADVLHLEKIGANDNFFELGGTSLSVASIIIEANKTGFTVNYGDVFANPTPRELATHFINEGCLEKPDTEITNYNYNKFIPLLEKNNLDNYRKGERQDIGNVLLTGATGFLGIHILQALLSQEKGKIYCLLRSKNGVSAESRLKTTLFYYFDNEFDELFNKRFFVIEGDITHPESFQALDGIAINTVFHCAANVKHFAADNQIERVNVGGVVNLLNYCEKSGARLVHTSTMSVGGLVSTDHPMIHKGLTEDKFYFKQSLKNKYIRSKFLAERHILERMLEGKVQAKIMRVGNLSARSTDGEFQINFNTNTFMGRLKSFCMLGKCAFESLDFPLEFSPIDEVAKAIILLATTPKECCIFHPFNHHFILLGDVLRLMSEKGMHIEPVEADEFKKALEEAESDPEKAKILSSILAYQNMDSKKVWVPMKKNNQYTMQVLYRLGYHWPIISQDYFNHFLMSIGQLGFFDQVND